MYSTYKFEQAKQTKPANDLGQLLSMSPQTQQAQALLMCWLYKTVQVHAVIEDTQQNKQSSYICFLGR